MATSTNLAESNSGGLREAMSCDVCSEVYERTLKTPLVLPCGHTFCRACLLALKQTGRFFCPNCRAAHNVQVDALTINYSLLNILPFCNDFMHEKCNTHGDNLHYWCSNCDLPLCSLCLYSGHPQGHTVKVAQIFVQEKKLALIEKIKLFFSNIEEQKKELKGHFTNLDTQMKKLFHTNAFLQDKLVALNDLLDETQKASDIMTIQYLEKAIKAFQCKENDASSESNAQKGEANEPSGIDNSKEGKDQESKSLQSCQKQQQSSDQALQTQETIETQCAIIDYRQGRLLLHSVSVPDSKGLSFQVPSEVFLELSVGGKCLGRVFISLWCHLRRAQQMLALCMGTMGTTLLETKASGKIRSILTFQYVVDGNNRNRSQPLLTNLEWGGHYTKPETEGYVAGMENGRDQGNSVAFGICTQSAVGVSMPAPFGIVVDGLEVVKVAFEHNPVTDINITRSGLVLPGLSP